MTCSLAPFALFTCWSSTQRRGRRGGEGEGRGEYKMNEMSDEGKSTGKGQNHHSANTKTASTPTPSQLAPPPPLFALSAPVSQTHALARLVPTPAQRVCPTSHPPAQPQTLPRPLSPLSWPLPPSSPVPRSASALPAVSQPAIRVADAGATRGDRPARGERELEAAGALMLAAAAAGHQTGRRHHRT